MPDIQGLTLTAGSGPSVYYYITYTRTRPSNYQMTYNFTISASLSGSTAYIGPGYALMCYITVNDAATQVRIKYNDGDDWRGTTPRTSYASVTCSSSEGDAPQYLRFQVVSDGRLRLNSSGLIDTSYYTVTSAPLLYSPCGAPTSCSVNSTLSEEDVTLTWSGATGGSNNSINAYEVYCADSSDNTNWGGWYYLNTFWTTAGYGSLAVSPPASRGYYRRFQVRTCGTAGSGYYSGWRVSSNSVRKATLPSAPTSCSVNTTLSEENVILSWSGADSGAGHYIASYEVQYSESNDNATWGGWNALVSVSLTAGSGSLSVAPPSARGNYRRFQVRAVPSSGTAYASSWRVSSNSVRRNTLPGAPTSVVASPAVYSDENVVVTWSGAKAGTSAIRGFRLSYSSATTDGSVGTQWYTIATIDLSSSGGSYTFSGITRTPGTYTTLGVATIDALGVLSDRKISNTVFCNVTACGAPTVCAVNIQISESDVTLSWSGATAGAGNAITGYEIQYSESADNASWGSWYALTKINTTASSGSLTVSPSATRGMYRRFQVRTLGVAGGAYYSPWKVTANSVCKNTLPTAPTTFFATPAIYPAATVTLAWSGARAGTGAIKQFVIQQSTSRDGDSWGAYEALATIVGSETSGSYTATVSNIPGTFTRFRISVTDTLGAVSSYAVSNMVKRNSPPPAPSVGAPANGSATYNLRPRVLMKTGTEPDGQTQFAAVRIGAAPWKDSVNHGALFSKNGQLGNEESLIFQAETQSPGATTITIRCLDSDIEAPSDGVSRAVTILPSPFEAITANETHVLAAHMQAIRTAANTVRGYYGLPAVKWSEEIVAGRTGVRDWPFHIVEIRRAIEPVIAKLNQFDSVSVFDIPAVTWLPIGANRPRADVMNQIQDLLLSL